MIVIIFSKRYLLEVVCFCTIYIMINLTEALRYMGIGAEPPADVCEKTVQMISELERKLKPRYRYMLYDLMADGDAFEIVGTAVRLKGQTASALLSECQKVIMLACTLGSEFDMYLKRLEAKDMSQAVICNCCGSAYVEAGCDMATDEILAKLDGLYITDRFSPGYGDIPLDVQPAICDSLNTKRTLGLYVTDTFLLNPTKSVTAFIGVSQKQQPAKIRGCAFCNMKSVCTYRKKGIRCYAG